MAREGGIVNRWICYGLSFLLTVSWGVSLEAASEVLENTPTKVTVKKHPKTGKPFVVIVAANAPEAEEAPAGREETAARPDYRLLDPKTRAREVNYQGPVSDRTKVYVLAASLATLGAVGGVASSAAIPAGAAASTGSAGGAGAFAAARTAVAAGTVSTAWLKTRPRPDTDEFTRQSESRVLEHGGSCPVDDLSGVCTE